MSRDTANCPNPEIHGKPFRYCPSCDWIEETPVRDPDLPAMAAYGAFCISTADRLGPMPPWEQIPAEARADWRAVADAVVMLGEMRP